MHATNPVNERTPHAIHRSAHCAPCAPSAATRTADRAMPVPTPAYGIQDNPGRPYAARRSRTIAVVSTIASALATPPANRSTMNAAIAVVSPIAAVVAALSARAPRSQRRGPPCMRARTAARAPSRWPRKLDDAMSPLAAGVRPSVSVMNGRIGVYANRPTPNPTARATRPPSAIANALPDEGFGEICRAESMFRMAGSNASLTCDSCSPRPSASRRTSMLARCPEPTRLPGGRGTPGQSADSLPLHVCSRTFDAQLPRYASFPTSGRAEPGRGSAPTPPRP